MSTSASMLRVVDTLAWPRQLATVRTLTTTAIIIVARALRRSWKVQ